MTREDNAADPSPAALELTWPFYQQDPLARIRVIRQVTQPCLAFKILAAGRPWPSRANVGHPWQVSSAPNV